jgi:hypothetical protein
MQAMANSRALSAAFGSKGIDVEYEKTAMQLLFRQGDYQTCPFAGLHLKLRQVTKY